MNKLASTGLVLASRFELERRIAVGGMGEVWQATDRVLGRPVAVKILRSELTESGGFLTRFRAEARLAAGLSHPGIAHVYDYAEDVDDGEQIAFLVMELIDGRPLSYHLGRRDILHLGQIVSILGQTAEALGAAHRHGIVHRDVKPGNLLITADGRVKVTDFGIARAIDSASITEVGEVIGTVRYMSPEQAMGEEATPASDVYSLGVVAYEMLSGAPPFTAESPAAIALAHVQAAPAALPSSVPDGLRSLIEQSLAKQPGARPPDGAAFASALDGLSIDPTQRIGSPAVPIETAPSSDPNRTVDVPRTAILPLSMVHLDGVPNPELTSTEISPTVPPLPETPLLGDGWIAQRRRRRVTVWGTAAALAAAFVLVVIAMNRTGDFSEASAAVSTVAETTVAPPPDAIDLVTVDPATYLGLTEAEAQAALSAAGLTAATTTGPSTADLTGVVIDVQPNGPVAPGSSVTIVLGDGTIAPATEQAPAGGRGNDDDGEGKGKGKEKD